MSDEEIGCIRSQTILTTPYTREKNCEEKTMESKKGEGGREKMERVEGGRKMEGDAQEIEQQPYVSVSHSEPKTK